MFRPLLSRCLGCVGAGAAAIAVALFGGCGPSVRARPGAEVSRTEPGGSPGSDAPPEQVESAALVREALAEAGRLVERFPQRAAAHHALGAANYSLGRLTDAERCWRRVLQLEPDAVDAYRSLAYVAMDRGAYAQAAELYRTLLAKTPDSADGRLGLAEASLNLGDLETARRLLEQNAVPRKPGSAPAFLLLGQVCLESNEFAEAKRHYQAAAELMPTAPQPYYGLAAACTKLGEADQAATYRRKFRELSDPEKEHRRKFQGVQADLAEVRGKVCAILATVGQVYAALGDQQEAERIQRRLAGSGVTGQDRGK